MPSPSTPSYRRRLGRSARRQLLPFLLLLPALVLVIGVLGYPIGQLFGTSFQELGLFQLIQHKVVWNGLTNYRELFRNGQFYSSLRQTAAFVAVCVGATMVLGTGVALLMRRVGKVLRTGVSVAMLLAWAMPSSAASIVWSWLFETQYGVVNEVASHLGLGLTNHNWFASQISAYSVIIMMIVWQAIPFVALSLYAGLTMVPNEVLEAAAVDGASSTTAFTRVVFPVIRPIFILMSVLSVIWDGNVFNQVWFLTRGLAQTMGVFPLGVWQYIVAFSSNDFGLGSAVAVVTVLLLLIVTGYYIRLMLRSGEVKA